MDWSENLGFLEEVSIGQDVNVAYKAEANEFFKRATSEGLRLFEADEIDRALVAFMNKRFVQDHRAWRGQKLLAPIVFPYGSSGRNSARKIPRS